MGYLQDLYKYATYLSDLPLRKAIARRQQEGTMDFGYALNALREGRRVTRPGWNGRSAFDPTYIPVDREPVIFNGLCYILLSDRSIAFCDEADYDLVSQQSKWSIVNGYPYFTEYGESPRTVKMHQLLNPEWKETDHRNGNKLDNRRFNLRPCTSQQNNANRNGKGGRLDDHRKQGGITIMAEKEEGVLTMCITNGMFVIGKLLGGGNKMIQPRVFDMLEEEYVDPETKTVKKRPIIRMQPLPGLPGFCYIPLDALKYPVITNVGNLMSLYKQVTTTVEERPNIVLPGPGYRMPPGMEQN